MFRCASSFNQSLCWNNLTKGWLGLRNIFCGSQGRFDAACATEDQRIVSACFSVDAELCASEVQTEPAKVQTDPANEKTWYTFTLPGPSNYVAAMLNVLLEFAMVLAFGAMFLRLESCQVSNLLRNGANA